MKQSPTKNIILLCIMMMIIGIGVLLLFLLLKSKEPEQIPTINPQEVVKEPVLEKVDIIDTNSDQRPYAVVVNNTPVAVKVQEGLKEAYLIYEFPTEGNTSRLMALYKTNKEITIGTIRSARHNFIDYANENDAIFVAYGWSVFAKKELQAGAVDYINGITGAGPFWRDNKENLAYEHTVYTNLAKIKEFVSSSYRMTSDVKPPIKYSTDEINLNSEKTATRVLLNYGPSNVENYIYDNETKMYKRNFNDAAALDHNTKEQVSVKNIIIVKITYYSKEGSKYLELNDTGSGEGYFVTNGKMIPITWKKDSRNSQTKYLNGNGEEITVNDGRTLIALIGEGREINIT